MDTNDIRPAIEEQIESTLDKGKLYIILALYRIIVN